MIDDRVEAFKYLKDLSMKKGYITPDDIIDVSDQCGLLIQDIDWLSNAVVSRGILLHENVSLCSENQDDYEDFAHIDYDEVFDRVIDLDISLKPFIEEVKMIRPPQRREMAQIQYQALEGNSYARNRIIEMYLRLAIKSALQWVEKYDVADINDAVGYACVGLVIAVDHFNPDINGKFASYSALWIQQTLGRYMPTRKPEIYSPAHRKEKFYNVYTEIKNNGCTICDKLLYCNRALQIIMDKTGYSKEQAADLAISFTPTESLDSLFEDIDLCMEEKYFLDKDTEDLIVNWAMKEDLRVFLNELKPRERDVLAGRYGLDGSAEETLESIGLRLGVTRERVRQIEAKALRKLRKSAVLAKMRGYLH